MMVICWWRLTLQDQTSSLSQSTFSSSFQPSICSWQLLITLWHLCELFLSSTRIFRFSLARFKLSSSWYWEHCCHPTFLKNASFIGQETFGCIICDVWFGEWHGLVVESGSCLDGNPGHLIHPSLHNRNVNSRMAVWWSRVRYPIQKGHRKRRPRSQRHHRSVRPSSCHWVWLWGKQKRWVRTHLNFYHIDTSTLTYHAFINRIGTFLRSWRAGSTW